MIIRVWLIVLRKWPTKPAECQVVPLGQAVLFEHNHLGPAESGGVIGHAALRHAAADNDHPRLGPHRRVLPPER
jgi:hypothetical protein